MNTLPPLLTIPKEESYFYFLRLMRKNMIQFVNKLACHGDFVRVPLGPFSLYFVNDPEAIRELMVTHANKFNKPSSIKRAAKSLFGENLFTSDGELWRKLRKVVTPAFHHRLLQTYSETMVANTKQVISHWQDGEVLDVPQEMMDLTLSTTTTTLYGKEINSRETGDAIVRFIELFNDRISSLFPVPTWIPTAKNREIKRTLQVGINLLQPMIDEKRNTPEKGSDVLSMLLEAQQHHKDITITDQQIYNEISNLFAAGYEVIPHTLAFTLYLIAQHPDVEELLLQEIDQSNFNEIFPELPYLEMVIKESMRLLPVTTVLARQATEDIDIWGFRIKKNSTVLISPWTLHRHQDYFDPQRFNSKAAINKYAYMPFGMGPRICIGKAFAMQQLKINLAIMLKDFRFTTLSNYIFEPVFRFNTRPNNGLPMRIHTRHCKQ